MLRFFVIGSVCYFLVAPHVEAQRRRRPDVPVPHTEGITLGAHTVVAQGITISGPGMQGEIKTNMGEGAGLQIGFGLTPRITAFVSADVAKQSTEVANLDGNMGLAHLELGGRFNFIGSGKRLVPYLTAMVGSRGLAARSTGGGIDLKMRISGTTIGAGLGFLYAFSPGLSLDAAVIGSQGKLGKMVITGDTNQEGDVNVDKSTNLRLKVGFQWHP